MTVEEIEQAVGIPTPGWVGHCNLVCWFVIYRGLAPEGADVEYGYWHGDVHPDSRFRADREILGQVRHAWIRCPDGTIIDPTRWAFETPHAPSVWTGRDSEALYERGLWPLRCPRR